MWLLRRCTKVNDKCWLADIVLNKTEKEIKTNTHTLYHAHYPMKCENWIELILYFRLFCCRCSNFTITMTACCIFIINLTWLICFDFDYMWFINVRFGWHHTMCVCVCACAHECVCVCVCYRGCELFAKQEMCMQKLELVFFADCCQFCGKKVFYKQIQKGNSSSLFYLITNCEM